MISYYLFPPKDIQTFMLWSLWRKQTPIEYQIFFQSRCFPRMHLAPTVSCLNSPSRGGPGTVPRTWTTWTHWTLTLPGGMFNHYLLLTNEDTTEMLRHLTEATERGASRAHVNPACCLALGLCSSSPAPAFHLRPELLLSKELCKPLFKVTILETELPLPNWEHI